MASSIPPVPGIQGQGTRGRLHLLPPLSAVADNGAMEAEPPKRKRRWYQFSLRTLLFVVVPYIAVYALVLSAILSHHEHPKPVGTAGNVLYDLRMAGWEFSEALGVEVRRRMAFIFTAIWVFLPMLSWAIWRSASRLRRWQRGAATLTSGAS